MSRGSDFWSRRKAQVEAEADAEATAAEAAELALHEAKLAERSDEDLLEELGLPDPDSLQPGDDFKAFMAKAVPDRLRRRALRRLWLSNPALANLDGLLDYGEDFTDSAKVIENMQTAYQVGKGMKAHVDEMIRQAELEDNLPEEADPLPEQDETDEALTLADEAGQVPALDIAEVDEVEDENEDLYTTAPRRRMHFEFEDQAGGPA